MNQHHLAALSLAGLALAMPAQAADKVTVGFLSTLSGPGGALGIDIRDGFDLALKHSGGKLGGRPTEVTVVDDQQNPDVGRQAIERFLKRDRVDVVTGMVFSNVLLPVVPAVLASDTVYISTNTGPQDYAGEKCNANFFVVSWQNEDIPSAMGKHATDKGYRRVALIAPNYPGGRESLGGFKRLYKGEVVDEIYTKLGQPDYAAELAQIRAAKPDAVFFFLPGAMGTNFIKQFVAAGLKKNIALLAPGFSGDQDTIKSVGEPMLGLFNTAQWSPDLDVPANKKFVQDFVKEYGRLPTLYASQGYDAAMLLNGAVRDVNGKVEDKAAFRKALRAANFQSVRGSFKFNRNQYPIQTYYLRTVELDSQGQISNRIVSTVLKDYADPFAASCNMK